MELAPKIITLTQTTIAVCTDLGEEAKMQICLKLKSLYDVCQFKLLSRFMDEIERHLRCIDDCER